MHVSSSSLFLLIPVEFAISSPAPTPPAAPLPDSQKRPAAQGCNLQAARRLRASQQQRLMSTRPKRGRQITSSSSASLHPPSKPNPQLNRRQSTNPPP